MDNLERNKAIVTRFNKEVIEEGNRFVFEKLMDRGFINRSAPLESNGMNGMWNTFANVLRPAMPDMVVEILDQIAEGDKVTTRKTITGTHKGVLMGIQPTGKKLRIDVIDIIRIQNGKYAEHWGINSLQAVINELKKLEQK